MQPVNGCPLVVPDFTPQKTSAPVSLTHPSAGWLALINMATLFAAVLAERSAAKGTAKRNENRKNKIREYSEKWDAFMTGPMVYSGAATVLSLLLVAFAPEEYLAASSDELSANVMIHSVLFGLNVTQWVLFDFYVTSKNAEQTWAQHAARTLNMTTLCANAVFAAMCSPDNAVLPLTLFVTRVLACDAIDHIKALGPFLLPSVVSFLVLGWEKLSTITTDNEFAAFVAVTVVCQIVYEFYDAPTVNTLQLPKWTQTAAAVILGSNPVVVAFLTGTPIQASSLYFQLAGLAVNYICYSTVPALLLMANNHRNKDLCTTNEEPVNGSEKEL